MNQNALTCPTQQRLMAFVAGKLNVTESAEIEQHLAECESCCQLLKMLPDNDTLVSLLRDPQAETAEDNGRSPRIAPTLPPVAEQLTLPPGGATEIADATATDGALSLPESLRDHSRYRVTQLLGRGGMGDVYKAHHRMMNRPVALKVMNAQLVSSHAAVQRFHREVQAAARLTHPNIVTAFDAEQAGDTHFLVMEFVDGTDLASVVNQRGPMSVAEACDYIRQAAEGLQHAHERGMVHRDIKPHNLMLAAGGQVRILDFGLAAFTVECGGSTPLSHAAEPLSLASAHSSDSLIGSDKESDFVAIQSGVEPPHSKSLTALGSVMGTPDYIAPEQAKDAHTADIRADIYSLGCTLHFLLTGQPPFEADNVLMKLKAHAEQSPPMLTALRNDVPAELANVVSRMMAKNPAERFQTPAEVAAALAPFAKPAASPPRRRRGLVAAALAGAALLLAGMVVVVTSHGRLEIQSEVDEVQVVVEQNGEQVAIVDLKTGSQVKWLPTGKYELKLKGGYDNDIMLDRRGFTMSRLGKVIVTARWNAENRTVIRAFTLTDEPITSPTVLGDVEIDDDAWRLKAFETRTVRLFETPLPLLAPGPFFYRAKLKTENVKGRAYLEMWVRFPGEGEYFSKGFHNAITGTNGWAEYEIPFFLKKGQQPDLVKLNLAIEGGGTVWIKDIQLRGRQTATPEEAAVGSDHERIQGMWVAESGQRYGEATPLDKIDMQRMVFAGDKLHVEGPGGKKGEGHFLLIESTSPKQIGVFVTADTRGLRGIYKLEGDRLTICLDKDQSADVPKTFAAPARSTLDLIVLRRATSVPPVADAAQGPPSGVVDRLLLQGLWIAVSGHAGKQAIPAEQLPKFSITIDQDQITIAPPGSPSQVQRGTFTVNATSSPKRIDTVVADKKEPMVGIYEVDQQRLKLALVEGDAARPTNFEPAQTPDHMTAVFQRVPGSVPTTVPRDEPVAAPVLDETQKEVVKAAEAYLAVMDEGRFGQLRDMVASMAKPHVTREQVSQTYQKLRDTFGKAERRTLERVQLFDEFPNLPAGRYAAVQYKTDFERQKGLWESLLLNVDTDGQWRVNTYANTLEPMPLPETKKDPVIEQKKQAALSAAQDWLTLVDAVKYGESWEKSAKINRDGISKQQMIDAYKELFQPLGTIKSRTFKSNEYTTQMPRAPVGEYAVIQFNTQFTNGRIVETVIPMLESDGHWRVAGYRHAEDNSPPTPPPATSTPPQRNTGLLTNPPKLPPEGVPVGRNLIVDPSLEETPTGGLPQGWFAWLDDGPDFKCEVVEGGVTGKHCLQISGTGTRGVVFATSIPLDRTKRYALKGRVKVEGEAGTWAVIKLNYFNNTGWLGVDDRIGVSSSDLDWKVLEKTDRAEKYPAATLLVPTCHIEGNGTAWFDDLEVMAYDHDSLPENFDAKHGRNNRMK